MLSRVARAGQRTLRRRFAGWLRPAFVLLALGAGFALTLAALNVVGSGPVSTLGDVGRTLPRTALLLIAALACSVLLGAIAVAVVRHGESWRTGWQSTQLGWRVLGVVTTVTTLTAGTVAVASWLDPRIGTVHVAAMALVAGPVCTLCSWRAMSDDGSGRWIRSLATGGTMALAVGVVVLLAGLPYPAVLAIVWIIWSLGTGWWYASAGRGPSHLAVRTGYAQLRRIEPRTVGTAVGFACALGVGLAVAVVWSEWGGLLAYLLAWPFGTALASTPVRRDTPDETTLTVTAIHECDGRASRELVIENSGEEAVDLSDARLQDTDFDRFRLGSDVRIERGERRVLAVPPAFDLAPGDASIDLPLGYTLTQPAMAPVVYTREGEAFTLVPDSEMGNPRDRPD